VKANEGRWKSGEGEKAMRKEGRKKERRRGRRRGWENSVYPAALFLLLLLPHGCCLWFISPQSSSGSPLPFPRPLGLFGLLVRKAIHKYIDLGLFDIASRLCT